MFMVHKIALLTSSPGHTDRKECQILPTPMCLNIAEKKQPSKHQQEHRDIRGCSTNLSGNACQKQSQQPRTAQFLTWGNLFYPRLALLITPTFTLISSETSHKQIAIDTLPSKGTQGSMSNPLYKNCCASNTNKLTLKTHLCCKTISAFTFHK